MHKIIDTVVRVDNEDVAPKPKRSPSKKDRGIQESSMKEKNMIPTVIEIPESRTPKLKSSSESVHTCRSTTVQVPVHSQKKKKSHYPNLRYWAEDGTDGFNRLPSNPPSDDDGIISAMLEDRLPPPPSPTRKTQTPETTNRVRELIDESEVQEIESPRKRSKISSEGNLRRQILSPDLATKNKGKGRYASSM